MEEFGKKQRVIGILHTLKKMKEVGLVEEETRYPNEAIKDVQSEMLSVAERWYEIGARRGALEILDAILNGDFEIRSAKNGSLSIVANNIKPITWSKALNVKIGNKKEQVPKQTYELTLEELGFEVPG